MTILEILEAAKDIVANLGFPIACVIAMFIQMDREREAHKKESETWVEALNRNTNVMEKLLSKMGE